MKINQIFATRCYILRLKCTKFNFRWGFCSRSRWESIQRFSRPLTGFKGLTSKGRREKGMTKRGRGKKK